MGYITSSILDGIGGYLTYKEQVGNSSQAGFMTKNQRVQQRRQIAKRYDVKGKEISHIYGTYGNNRNYYQLVSKPEHIAFHKLYGYKTNGGHFNRINPNYCNWWSIIKILIGA